MPTPAAEQPGVGTAAKQVAEHASTLAKLGARARRASRLKRKAGALGAGVGLGIGAAVVAVYALGFLFATIAVALALVLDPGSRCCSSRSASSRSSASWCCSRSCVQARHTAGSRAGDPRGQADVGGAEDEWPTASRNGRRTPEAVRREIEAEREGSAVAVEQLRGGLGDGDRRRRQAARASCPSSPRARSARASSSPAGSARRCACSPARAASAERRSSDTRRRAPGGSRPANG